MTLEDVTITEIGARGDGIAETPKGRLYVPYAAPGERLRVRLGAPRGDGRAATIDEILEPSPDRSDSACKHFGTCGGCTLQHIASRAVADLKREFVTTALGRHGCEEAPVEPTITIPPGKRRRARFAFHPGRRPALGFNLPASRKVLNIEECPVLRPELATLIGPLRTLCGSLRVLAKGADLQVTLTSSGLDLLIIPNRPAEPDLPAREALAAFAEAQDLCRVSWQTGDDWEPIAARRPVTVSFAGTPVAIPPAAFLQPNAEGEAAIVQSVTSALAEAAPARIADLYAGCGALTFPTASIAPIHAVEGDAAMTDALRTAAHDRVSVSQRDLHRTPLSSQELSAFDAVIFDPPRAGARPLATALAESSVATIAAVSCNPATLARDLRILVDGGYRLERVTPIDQFPWSAHVEAVAILRR